MTKYSDIVEQVSEATTAPSCDSTIKIAHDRRHAVGFAGNWVAGAGQGSRSLRRRLVAVLRRAHRVLGLKRDRLGLGTLGVGGAVGSVGASSPAFIRGAAGAAAGVGVVLLGWSGPAAAQEMLTINNQNDTACTLVYDLPTGPLIDRTGSRTLCNTTATNRVSINGGSMTIGGDNKFAINGGVGLRVLSNGAWITGGTDVDGQLRAGPGVTVTSSSASNIFNSDYFRTNSTAAAASASGANSVAVGSAAIASAAKAAALGSEASASSARAIALGSGATAGNVDAVALGSNSVTAVAVGTASTVIAGTTYGFAGGAPGSTVSVGAPGAERTITNVAAGRLSAASTDAVNGSQLFATNTAVDGVATSVNNVATNLTTVTNTANNTAAIVNNINNGAGIKYFHANSTLADSTATGTDSVAIGPVSTAAGANAVSIGNGAAAGDAGAVALGAGSTTAAAVGTGGVTIAGTNYGFAGVAPGSTVSVGAPGAERTITNVAAGRLSATSTDAVNGSQLFATNQAVDSVATTVNNVATTANNTAAIVNNINNGAGIKYFHTNSTLADSTATGTNAVAIGPVSAATAVDSVSIGNGATAGNAGAVALGAGSVTAAAVGTGGITLAGKAYTFAGVAPGSTVSVGAAGAERTITNVAAGRISATSTDAINGSQLFATNTAVDVLNTTVTNINNGAGIKYFHANSTLADSLATGTNSVAIGPVSAATAVDTVAIGNGAKAGNAGAVALGTGSVTAAAVGTGGITLAGKAYAFAGAAPGSTVSVGAVGAERTITNVAAGRLSATSTDAINGSQLFATNTAVDILNIALTNINNGGGIKYFHANSTLADSTATGTNSVAIGPVATAIGTNAVSIGNGAKATNANDIALGAGSVTAAAVGTGGITLAGKAYTFAGATPGSTVSVGAVGAERTITNVAAGRLSATSTDAVNGSQLFATNTAVEVLAVTVNTINNGGGIKYFRTNSTLADASATGTNSVAIGPVSTAAGANSVSIGNGAKASNAGDVALGAGSVTDKANPTAGITIADKSYTFAGGAPTSVVSVGAPGAERQITNVAAGRVSATSTDAINGSQLFATNQAVESVATTVNTINNGGGIKYFHANSTLGDSTAGGTDSVAVGPLAASSATNAVSMGNGASASANNAIAIGAGAKATQANSLALGAGSTTTANLGDAAYAPFVGTTVAGVATGEVSVGSAGAERRVTNVAAGASPTDAVNVSQLQAVASNVMIGSVRYDTDSSGNVTNRVTLAGGTPGGPVNIGNVAPGVNGTDAVNVNQLNSAVGSLNGDIRRARKEAWRAAAIGLAAASLRYDDRPGKISAAIGGGMWRGEGAYSMGLGFTAHNGWMRGNLAVTTSGGNWGIGIGATFTLN